MGGKTGKDIGLGGIWGDAPVISQYTADDAVADGMLVPVDSKLALEAGFKVPVQITKALEDILRKGKGDYKGRLWDVLFMLRFSIKLGMGKGDRVKYRVKIGRANQILLSVMDGAGITIGFPGDF